MGKCIKCGNYCKNHHNYCLSCWSNLISHCFGCKKDIFDDEEYLIAYIEDEEEIYICQDCINKITNVDNNKSIGNCNDCETEIFKDDDFILFNINNKKIYLCKDCSNPDRDNDNRNKYEHKFRADDGHMLMSRGEVIIDNYLFKNNIMHVYEKKVYDKTNVEESCTCDFYLPIYDLYIEFWGMENNQKYESQKEWKEKIYITNNFDLINIYPYDLDNGIDDFLNKEFLKRKNKKSN